MTGFVQNDSNLETNKKLKIYPNPFTNSARIEIPNYSGHVYSLSVFDMLGNIVRVKESISDGQISFERKDLTEGLYFLELSSENETFNAKMIIK